MKVLNGDKYKQRITKKRVRAATVAAVVLSGASQTWESYRKKEATLISMYLV